MHKAVLTVISLLACQAAIAAGYDFYANTVYPGANLRPDVELYEVKQSGGEDPNWGYGNFAAMPFGEEECVLMTMARTGEQRGMFKNGIRGFGDTVGEYGARLTTFDCELEDVYRRTYFAPTRNWLETVDADKRIYRIPLEEAPEPFG